MLTCYKKKCWIPSKKKRKKCKNPSNKFFIGSQKEKKKRKNRWQCYVFLLFMSMVILSAFVEKLSVSGMRDLTKKMISQFSPRDKHMLTLNIQFAYIFCVILFTYMQWYISLMMVTLPLPYSLLHLDNPSLQVSCFLPLYFHGKPSITSIYQIKLCVPQTCN